MSTRYQVLPPTAPVPAPDDVLEQLVRQGARRDCSRTHSKRKSSDPDEHRARSAEPVDEVDMQVQVTRAEFETFRQETRCELAELRRILKLRDQPVQQPVATFRGAHLLQRHNHHWAWSRSAWSRSRRSSGTRGRSRMMRWLEPAILAATPVRRPRLGIAQSGRPGTSIPGLGAAGRTGAADNPGGA